MMKFFSRKTKLLTKNHRAIYKKSLRHLIIYNCQNGLIQITVMQSSSLFVKIGTIPKISNSQPNGGCRVTLGVLTELSSANAISKEYWSTYVFIGYFFQIQHKSSFINFRFKLNWIKFVYWKNVQNKFQVSTTTTQELEEKLDLNAKHCTLVLFKVLNAVNGCLEREGEFCTVTRAEGKGIPS